MALHFLLILLFTQVEDSPLVSKRDKKKVPLEIVFQDPKKAPQFIQVPDNQKEVKEKPKKEVRFKSDKTRRTELETFKPPVKPAPMRANLSSGGGQGSKNKQEEQSKNSEVASSKGVFKTEEKRKPLQMPGYGSTSSPPTIPAYVQQQMPPGVRLGNITALNTDQHRFYSFNQRLLSRFIPLWGERVRSAIYQWLNDSNAPGISKSWVTNVEVIMNRKGEILDVQPFRLSGFWEIDQAAINSFIDIENVPNPPEEMIDENGYIHLQFQTEVLFVPQPGVRFHGGGP